MSPIEFGRQLSALRKKKGLTQAELAEKCRINIRSIQRIESGKVIPRAYTVNILSEILDSELTLPEMKNNWLTKLINKFDSFLNSFLVLSKNKKYGAKDLKKKLKIAWIAGIMIFALSIPETILYFVREYSYLSYSEISFYILIAISTIIFTILFMRGFILIGINLNNNLLIIGSYLIIASTIIEFGFELYSLNIEFADKKHILGIFSVIDGFIFIFYGLGLFRIETVFGNTAKFAGLLSMITGFTFIVIILFFIGLILLIPINILEILILYKAASKLDWIQEKAAVA